MTPAQARRVLERALAEVEARLRADGGPVRANGRGDEADLAVQRRELAAAAATREQLLLRRQAIGRALERIAGGGWGVCTECGGAIAPKRLAAMPEVATCRECQERIEAAARRLGQPMPVEPGEGW